MGEVTFKGIPTGLVVEREECLVHTPSCTRGDDGRWHRPDETPVASVPAEDQNVAPCSVCGKPLRVGEWGCISRIVEHAPSVQVNTFAAYFDIGLGIDVNNPGDRNAAMRGTIDPDSGAKVGQLDYRDKPSKGDLSARNDRIRERQKAEGRG